MPATLRHARIIAILAVGGATFVTAGCQTTQQALAKDDSVAINTALQRARFEMSCPDATGTVLSSDMLQPVLWRGIERAEYQIGVSGCGKKATYVVICPEGSDDCLATANTDEPTN